MANLSRAIAATALLAVCGVACISPASAQIARPEIGQATTATGNLVTPVQYRRHWGGPGPGPAIGLGIGALIGTIIATQPPPYYYGPGYYPPPGDPVAYCMSRFKSYDPGSGTYLGYDGLRHPCP
ncbi:MAG: BA14K family protein [Xanthobacteraceae bacterium]